VSLYLFTVKANYWWLSKGQKLHGDTETLLAEGGVSKGVVGRNLKAYFPTKQISSPTNFVLLFVLYLVNVNL